MAAEEVGCTVSPGSESRARDVCQVISDIDICTFRVNSRLYIIDWLMGNMLRCSGAVCPGPGSPSWSQCLCAVVKKKKKKALVVPFLELSIPTNGIEFAVMTL